MGIFNDNIHNPHSTTNVAGRGERGERGPAGIGFKLNANGNYDIDNKKLTKVAERTDNSDAITKHQLDTGLNTKVNISDTSLIGNPEARKLVRYLPDEGIITPKLYIEDEFNDSVIIKSDDQDFDDVNLYIPNLKNHDGLNTRRKSNIVVNSIDNTFTGKIIIPSGNIKIKDGNDEAVINRADILKIYGSASGQNGINNNKCVLYDSGGNLF